MGYVIFFDKNGRPEEAIGDVPTWEGVREYASPLSATPEQKARMRRDLLAIEAEDDRLKNPL